MMIRHLVGLVLVLLISVRCNNHAFSKDQMVGFDLSRTLPNGKRLNAILIVFCDSSVAKSVESVKSEALQQDGWRVKSNIEDYDPLLKDLRNGNPTYEPYLTFRDVDNHICVMQCCIARKENNEDLVVKYYLLNLWKKSVEMLATNVRIVKSLRG